MTAICERFGIAISTLYAWKNCILEHKELLLGILADKKKPILAFLQWLLECTCLSERLQDFFRRHAFSFLQNPPMTTTHTRPP